MISTTETLFEALLVDNYKFIDISECFLFMDSILKQKYKIEKWVIPVSKLELFDRMRNMFFAEIYQDEYDELLSKYIDHLSDDEVTKIFYKNNLMVFTDRHDKIRNLHDNIFSKIQNLNYAKTMDDIPGKYRAQFIGPDERKSVKGYNSFVNNQYFMDPNSPPDTIMEDLDKLNSYYMKYVYTAFMSVDRIHRLKYFIRKCVCVVDTDSNILALDSWVDFCEKKLMNGDYGRSEENNRFIIINTLAYFITHAVADTLNQYGLNSYIPDEYRPRFSMKNEFEIKLIINSLNCWKVLYIKITSSLIRFNDYRKGNNRVE